MGLIVGTSGWQYRHWRGTFYPAGVAQARWLEFYAERFSTVESNAAFYRLPEAKTFAAWAERTPADFVMAVKASRYLTHVRRLRDPDQAVGLFVERAKRLGPKLGPVLIQLPPTLRADIGRLRAALAAFPADWRVAVEFRHDSWYTDEIRRLLTDRSVALCLADRRGPLTPIWRTTDWSYLRFHTGRASPEPCYGRQALRSWLRRLSQRWKPDEDVYVYFNNDPRACALRDAGILARAAGRAGVSSTRVPRRGEVELS
jgi:uncharacterized protein YecE (DUF72 family)